MVYRTAATKISIHASAKEATKQYHAHDGKCFNFNPRFREGSDGSPCSRPHFVIDFNPRFREGSDAHSGSPLNNRIISIHASAKEATLYGEYYTNHYLFQSTLPRRKRPMSQSRILSGVNFNPRFREGSDDIQTEINRYREIPIHASAKEATAMFRKKSTPTLFQSTLPRRKRHYGKELW